MEMKDRKVSRKKGEEGYHERNTDAAHKAVAVFETAEEFTEAANKYFDECDERGDLYGEAGLCLGLTKYNKKGRSVSLSTMQDWWDGRKAPYLQEAVQQAYLRIQAQIETDPRYQEKGGMATRSIFLQKQKRLGGYQDKLEEKRDTTIRIVHGDSMDASDFK